MSKDTLTHAAETHGFRTLLLFLLLYIFGSPFLNHYPSLAFLADSSLSITLLFSVYTVQRKQGYRSIAITFLLPVLLLYWLGLYDLLPFVKHGSYALLALYYFLLILSSVDHIRRVRRINIEVICSILCLYLIIGLFWGAMYTFMYEMSPNHFSGSLLDKPNVSQIVVFNYFSMVTLTTLGYGDITPQTVGAGSLCQMEAIIGQFFTAVLIAWFVGNYVAEKRTAATNEMESKYEKDSPPPGQPDE